jgi:uncharacterized protein YllA (UPF0747 family)
MLYNDDKRITKVENTSEKMDSKSMKNYQHIIPSEAIATNNFNEFYRMIVERFIDIKQKVKHLCEKIECENTILRTKSTELAERDKKNIRDYINRVEIDIEKWKNIQTQLHKLAHSKKRLWKVFRTINSNGER